MAPKHRKEKWSSVTAQVHTVDQTVHPPNKHSFVSQRLLVGRWPLLENIYPKTEGEGPQKQGLTHTHTGTKVLYGIIVLLLE